MDLADKGGGNVDIVAAKLNTSADWAGGGLVSTVEDLNVFIRAIFSDKLFQHKAALDEMTKPLGTLLNGKEVADPGPLEPISPAIGRTCRPPSGLANLATRRLEHHSRVSTRV